MHNVVLDADRIGVGGRFARFDASALVNGHIHDHGAGLHGLDHLFGDEHRGARADDEHGPNEQVGFFHALAYGVGIGHERDDVDGHDVVKIPQAIQVYVENGHLRAEARGDLRGVGAHDTAADDDDFGGRHAGHSAQQNPAAHHGLLQELGPLLDGHAAGHLAHRGQERMGAVFQRDGFVRNGHDLSFEHRLGQFPVGCEMEIREKYLSLADEIEFGRERLLDLHDHVGAAVDVGRVVNDLGSGLDIVIVEDAAARAGVRLDKDGVPSLSHLLDAHGKNADAVLVLLDLLGNTDDHGSSPPGD